eukprot:11284525-Alexandrium_andersonii.AAC.1
MCIRDRLYVAQAPEAAGRAFLPGAVLPLRLRRVEVDADASGEREAVRVRAVERVVVLREPGSLQ